MKKWILLISIALFSTMADLPLWALESPTYKAELDINNPVSPLYILLNKGQASSDDSNVGGWLYSFRSTGDDLKKGSVVLYCDQKEETSNNFELRSHKLNLFKELVSIKKFQFLYPDRLTVPLLFSDSIDSWHPMFFMWGKAPTQFKEPKSYGLYIFNREHSIFMTSSEFDSANDEMRTVLKGKGKSVLLNLREADSNDPMFYEFHFNSLGMVVVSKTSRYMTSQNLKKYAKQFNVLDKSYCLEESTAISFLERTLEIVKSWTNK